MAKKKHAHAKTRAIRTKSPAKETGDMLVVVRSWMFIVAFALMLGIGAVVGTYFNNLMNEGPQVAGAQTEIVR